MNIESICEEQKGMVTMMIKNGILERLSYVFLHETDPEVLVCILFHFPAVIRFDIESE